MRAAFCRFITWLVAYGGIWWWRMVVYAVVVCGGIWWCGGIWCVVLCGGVLWRVVVRGPHLRVLRQPRQSPTSEHSPRAVRLSGSRSTQRSIQRPPPAGDMQLLCDLLFATEEHARGSDVHSSRSGFLG